MTTARRGRQSPDGPLEAPPGWPFAGDSEQAIIGDFLNGGVFFEVERAPDGTPVSVRHLPREQALGGFLRNMLGGSDPEPGPPWAHTFTGPPPVVYARTGRVLYRPPAKPWFTLAGDGR